MTDLALVRDGTIFGQSGTEIDLRTPDYSVWITVKADTGAEAEAVVDALLAAFPADEEASE